DRVRGRLPARAVADDGAPVAARALRAGGRGGRGDLRRAGGGGPDPQLVARSAVRPLEGSAVRRRDRRAGAGDRAVAGAAAPAAGAPSLAAAAGGPAGPPGAGPPAG